MKRREFLGGVAATLLAGCSVEPSQRTWGFWKWAEPLSRRLLEAGPFAHALVKEYPRSAISRDFPIRSLIVPQHYADGLTDWTLAVTGQIAHPRTFPDLASFAAAFPKVGHVTRHDCVEGWSAIGEWAGVRLSDLIDQVKPLPEARYVVFYSADADESGTPYYGSLDLQQAMHPQTILAYELNGASLPLEHGAPLRLKVPTQLGYKSTKFIQRIAFVDRLEGIGGGKGGYWEDTGYEHYAGV